MFYNPIRQTDQGINDCHKLSTVQNLMPGSSGGPGPPLATGLGQFMTDKCKYSRWNGN